MTVDRRQFVRRTSLGASLGAASISMAVRPVAGKDERQYGCRFAMGAAQRRWLGPELWANPLPDWRVKDGVAECLRAAPNRNVQRLTLDLSAKNQPFDTAVTLTRVGGRKLAGRGSAGFTIGIRGPLEDFRNRLVFGTGLAAGLTMDGRVFIGRPDDQSQVRIGLGSLTEVQLRLLGKPAGNKTALTLQVVNPANGKLLGQTTKQVPAHQLAGNLGVTANFGGRGRGAKTLGGVGQFGFGAWTIGGPRVLEHPERRFGPVFFTQYTLHQKTLTLTAQLPPLAADLTEAKSYTVKAKLSLWRDGRWVREATAAADPMAWTATFRIEDWDDSKDTRYRVSLEGDGTDGEGDEGAQPGADGWEGVIRKDPRAQDELVVADISCNHHAAFPNAQYAENMRAANPDLLAFTGDQFYESSGGYGIIRTPVDLAVLDYLHKWLLHGWTWRELTRDRPSIALPDDHDVYQGNVWGEGGAPRQSTQEAGGYTMAAEWVNVVHRTQTSHLPHYNDDDTAKQDISVYFGGLTYGGISFALLADRMFKTGPDGVAPKTKGRADHVTDPAFDPRTADVAGAELLGERQMKFLQQWVEDWDDAVMKAVVSQTVFTAIATTHGRNRQRLVADYDTNAWPQTERNAALRLIRKCGAVHLAGDQHLPAVVRYGIEKHGDAGVAFAGPAVNVGYPRWWEPTTPGRNSPDPSRKELGDFTDSFGHPMTMLAVFNPAVSPASKEVLRLMQEKGSGYGLVRFDKKQRKVTFECYPYLASPADPEAKQFPGWPIVVPMGVQRGKPLGHLPPVRWPSDEEPLVKVYLRTKESDELELQYALRPVGTEFLPPYFHRGRHFVEVTHANGERHTEQHDV